MLYEQSAQSGRLKKPVSSIVTRVYAMRWLIVLCLDKEYRKAVHWLETLRLRRVKLLEGGYNV